MNNRVQQRFDRSIRQAMEVTANAAAARDAEHRARREAEARQFLPEVERRIVAGGNRPEMLAALKDMRAGFRRVLGLKLDRSRKEMPTLVVGGSGGVAAHTQPDKGTDAGFDSRTLP